MAMAERCGSLETTTGKPCRFPKPEHACPFHGDGIPPENGRPSKYTDELATEILGRMALGETVRAICRDPDIPVTHSTVVKWAHRDDPPGFYHRYVQARTLQADAWFEEAVERAQGVDREDPDSHEATGRDRLVVDTLKWGAGKLAPNRYGKRVRQEITGAGGGPIEVDVSDARQKLEKELDQIAKHRATVAASVNGDG